MAEKRRPCAKCGKNRAERFYTSARGRVCSTCRRKRTVTGSRNQRLQDTYGITEQDYQAILDAQGGCCAICGGKRRGNLDVDHDHGIEKALVAAGQNAQMAARMSIRGLLCRRCNRRLLPACKDDHVILRCAIAYLDRPPAPSVLSSLPGQ